MDSSQSWAKVFDGFAPFAHDWETGGNEGRICKHDRLPMPFTKLGCARLDSRLNLRKVMLRITLMRSCLASVISPLLSTIGEPMDNPVLPSTAFLTVLLAIGLFFFIRASAKDRIEVAKLLSDRPQETVLEELQHYFNRRAYRLVDVDAERGQVKYEGMVSASPLLAGFLTLLAAIGLLCLSLVLAFLFPAVSNAFLLLVTLAPAAGLFYWRSSQRVEAVYVSVETVEMDETSPKPDTPQNLVTVTGHRDELAELQRSLPFTLLEQV